MKTRFAIILLLLVYSVMLSAAIGIQQATSIGEGLFSHFCGYNRQSSDAITFTNEVDNMADFYVLRFQPTGFIVIAAEEQSEPLLAYSKDNSFPDGDLPAHIKWYLGEYSRSMAEIRSNPAWSLNPTWQALRTSNYEAYPITRDVSPLCSTHWNQNWPYNSLCPMDSYGPGGRVYAGCVALSIAQIMKKWGAPSVGLGSHSYTAPGYGYQSANFGVGSYNWAGMPNSLTSVNMPISTIIYHCGVAVETQYGADASGALSEDVRDALVSHFRYNPAAVYRLASSYLSATWLSLLRADLDLGRPIYYSGSNGSAGHSFVLDGYTGTNYFHINWGWGGSFDGYYYLTNLNPNSYDFNYGQAAVMNIYPLTLDPPTNVVAVEEGDDVEISWETSTTVSKVWRLQDGEQSIESQWIALTPTGIVAQTFTDEDWSDLPDGTYYWAVKSANTIGLVSLPVLSNPIIKSNVAITQTIALSAGWNLISLNVTPVNPVLSSMTATLGNNLIQIKGMEGVYIPGSPYSTLTSVTNGRAYNVRVSTPETWGIRGIPISTNTPIGLQAGWSMLAFYPTANVSVPVAMQSVSSALQQIKGRDGVYIPGNPMSSLSHMRPGAGYWVKLSGAQSLVYSGTKNDVAVLEDSDMVANLKVLPGSMTAIIACNEAKEGDALLAMVGSELRAYGKFICPEGFPAALVQIFTEQTGEEICFYIQKPGGERLRLLETIISNPEADLGLVMLSAEQGEVDTPAIEPQLLGCYPNPFNPSTNISFSLVDDNSHVRIDVFNIKGQLVNTLLDRQMPKGLHNVAFSGADSSGRKLSSGVYVVRMNSGAYYKSMRVMLSK
jgi:hypothetical protein